MDKRFFLALFLSLIAIAISQLLFPPVKRTSSNPAADSLLGEKSTASSTQPMTVRPSPAEARATTVSQTRVAVATTPTGPAPLAAETATVTTPRAIYKFSNVGAAPVSIVIRDYKNRSAQGGLVDLGAPGSPLVSYRLVTPTDTADLAEVVFKLARTKNSRGDENLVYNASVKNLGVSITYLVSNDTAASYVLRVDGRVTGTNGISYLITELPRTL